MRLRWKTVWKALGVAGVAGVAATGAIIARDQRQRAQLSPEEVRDRLRARVDADRGQSDPGRSDRGQSGSGDPSTDSSARA